MIVNRIWSHHFGRGIVATLDNFGKMGEKPTHPELLDWLAVEFMNRGWSIKQMHRLIMTSEAYQMASQFSDAGDTAKDPENQYLWRFRIQRLDAEIVRDAMMAASGALDLTDRRPAGVPAYRRRRSWHRCTSGIWKQEEDGPRVVAAQRLRLSQARAAVPDVRGVRPARSEHQLRRAECLHGAHAGADAAQRRVRAAAGQAVRGPRAGSGAGRSGASRWTWRIGSRSSRPPRDGRSGGSAADFLRKRSLADFTHVLLNLNEFLYVR